MRIASYEIDDPLDQIGAVEITIRCTGGQRRWCYFMTPASLSVVGNWVPGTKVPFHYGAAHMIVVAELTAGIIEAVLRLIEAEGELAQCTLAVDDEEGPLAL